MSYRLNRTGDNVASLLTKIEELNLECTLLRGCGVRNNDGAREYFIDFTYTELTAAIESENLVLLEWEDQFDSFPPSLGTVLSEGSSILAMVSAPEGHLVLQLAEGENDAVTPTALMLLKTMHDTDVATNTPVMDGTGAVGTSGNWARGDHQHPSDTSKQDVISDLATIRSGAALGTTSMQDGDVVVTSQDGTGRLLTINGTTYELVLQNEPSGSTNAFAAPTWGALTTLLATKQDVLTIDNYPSERSTNPVTSKGIVTYVANEMPTKTSDLTNDSGFITSYTETDPVFTASPAATITSSDIANWNNSSGGTTYNYYSEGTESASIDTGDASVVVNETDDGTIVATATHVQMRGVNGNTSITVGDDGIHAYSNAYFKYNNVQIATTSDVSSEASARSDADTALQNNIDAKQDTISDLATIRSGAAAGAAAYQKPDTGIPKTDLASAVQTSLDKADSALQSYTESDPVFTASAAANITSTDITNWNAKADADDIPTKTSDLTNDSGFITEQDISGKVSKTGDSMTGVLQTSSAIYLTNVASSVHSGTSRLYFGSVSSPTNYISANSSGAFGIYNSAKNGVTCYPGTNFFPEGNTGTIDLGRTDKRWKNFYVNGALYSGSTSISFDDLISGASLGATALQSFTETDPVFTASAAHGITSADITSWNDKADVADIPTKTSDLTNDSGFITDAGVTSFNGSTGAITYTAPVTSVNGDTGAVTVDVPTKTSDLTNDSGFTTNTGTITGITMNGSSKGTSGVVDLGTVITEHQDISSKANVSALASYTPTANFATINGTSITGGGNITIAAAEGQTITIDATPTSGSSNAVSSDGVYDAVEGGYYY